MSSIKEIADRVGISPASVSIYLNDRETRRVGSKTKKLIDQAVKDLGYRKNVFARSLSTHVSKIIGIIIPTTLPLFQNSYTNVLLSGIQTQLSSRGYSLLFFPSSSGTSIEIVEEQLEKSAGCDGYILFSTGFCTMEQIDNNINQLERTGKSFVTLNIPKVDRNINQILLEDLYIPRGLQYLIENGHKELLVVLGRRGGEHTRKLEENCRILAQKEGLDLDSEKYLFGGYSWETAYERVKNSLSAFPETTGICCMSDLMASGAIKAARELGLAVPGDISVIGRNNSSNSVLSDPPLSTFDLHMSDMGTAAAELLLRSLSKGIIKQKILMTGSLVERDSVRNLREQNK